MRRALAAAALLAPGLLGCGGLRHIPDVSSEPNWRPLGQATVAAAAQLEPAPLDVPLRQLEMKGAFVAVFDIQDKSGRLSAQDIDGMTDYLASKLAEDGLFHVVPRDEIKKRILEQKKESYRACYEQSCQIEIGREMAAQKSLATTVVAIGSSCLVTAALYDLKKAATDATASSRGGCSADELIAQIEQVISKFRRMAR